MNNLIESFNNAEHQQLYGTAMLERLIAACADQEGPFLESAVIPLLKSTIRFRDIADPGEFFSTLRNAHGDEGALRQVLREIDQVFDAAAAHRDESELLDVALSYCAASILDRLQDLAPDDKLQRLVNEETV